MSECSIKRAVHCWLLLLLSLLLSACDSFKVEQLPLSDQSTAQSCDPKLVGSWLQDGKLFLTISEDCKAVYGMDTDKQTAELIPTQSYFLQINGRSFVALRDPSVEAPGHDQADALDRGYLLIRYQVDGDQLQWSEGDVKAVAHEIIDGQVAGELRVSKYNSTVLLTGDANQIAFALARRDYFSSFKTTLQRANAKQSKLAQRWIAKLNAPKK